MKRPAAKVPRGSGGKTPAGARRGAVQYTVRDVPAQVDHLLRRKAADAGLSLNQVLRDALAREAGADPGTIVYDDLDPLAGAWDEDAAVDQALAEQDRVDEGLWK